MAHFIKQSALKFLSLVMARFTAVSLKLSRPSYGPLYRAVSLELSRPSYGPLYRAVSLELSTEGQEIITEAFPLEWSNHALFDFA